MNILLVEDNLADVDLLREMITDKAADITLHNVADGHQALDYLFQRNAYTKMERPDLVMLDLGLPRISGYEVLREVKQQPLFADMPVVIMTTSRDPLDRSQCKALGADSFVSKPHNLEGYEALVDRLVGEEFQALCHASAHRTAG